uniref:Uncharacterized protein n=1 Tax=Meloidogyne floridensis TaxID=298350 RepID=A0A915PD60_9BILA
MESSSAPKKSKKSPLQSIKLGEAMIDIKLKIITNDAVRMVKDKHIVWTIVGTDGFMKTYNFKNFTAKQVANNYNYGSVNYELDSRDTSSVELVTKGNIEMKDISEKTYFDFLKKKFTIDDKFKPLSIEEIQIDNSVDIVVQLFSIKEVRSVVVKNKYQAKVLDVSVLINNCTSKITAWNILAELLFFLLAGKEDVIIKLQNVTTKKGFGKELYAFNFTNNSKIEVQEKKIKQKEINCLKDIEKITGLIKCKLRQNIINNCKIRMSIIKKPTLINTKTKTNGTIITDGINKAQFFYPNTIIFNQNDEFILESTTINKNEG